MNVYVDKNGFTHLRKSKNRWYLGQLVRENVVLLSPVLSDQVHGTLSKAKMEVCELEEAK